MTGEVRCEVRRDCRLLALLAASAPSSLDLFTGNTHRDYATCARVSRFFSTSPVQSIVKHSAGASRRVFPKVLFGVPRKRRRSCVNGYTEVKHASARARERALYYDGADFLRVDLHRGRSATSSSRPGIMYAA